MLTSLLKDSFGRQFHYLRLSITDVCNFKCLYCLPDGYQKPSLVQPPLEVSEIRNLVSGFASLGLWKVRLTGGEPTVRKDLLEIVRSVSEVKGIRKIALTTNGYRLKAIAKDLKAAGVDSLNVSVDSLDAKRFESITGGERRGAGSLRDVLDGIESAFVAGFSSVKINVVLLRGINDDEVGVFSEWTKRAQVNVRFIELMETGKNAHLFNRHHVSSSAVTARLCEEGWKQVDRELGGGPATEFIHEAHLGRIGVIAPYSKNFCTSCNRVRVSSGGGLRLCLFGDGEYPLRPLLQDESRAEELVSVVQSLIGQKSPSHKLNEGKYGNISNLASIGG